MQPKRVAFLPSGTSAAEYAWWVGDRRALATLTGTERGIAEAYRSARSAADLRIHEARLQLMRQDRTATGVLLALAAALLVAVLLKS
ncbi:MAG: hypothetical protein RKU31_31980 [Deltaproteobacteria bacterium]